MIASAKGNFNGSFNANFLWIAPLYHEVEKLSVTKASRMMIKSRGAMAFKNTKLVKKAHPKTFSSYY